jgi:hypothetical protein
MPDEAISTFCHRVSRMVFERYANPAFFAGCLPRAQRAGRNPQPSIPLRLLPYASPIRITPPPNRIWGRQEGGCHIEIMVFFKA